MHIAGAVLAGGNSSRMGRDKSYLEFEGKSLLDHMRELLLQSGIQNVYTSRSGEIIDEIPDCSPIGGIHAVMNSIHTDYSAVIFVPVDMPNLAPSLIQELISAPNDTFLVGFEGGGFSFSSQH